MENRRKCSKISTKWKQLTSIALRTTAHCAGPEVRTTYLGIKGAHIETGKVRSGQKRVDVSVAKKSFLQEDLRRFGDLRLQTSDVRLQRGELWRLGLLPLREKVPRSGG